MFSERVSMSRILFLLCIVVVALTGCNEQKKIDALKQENARLEAAADSLKALIAKAQGETSKWLVKNDTVRAGDGLFQVLYRMNINEKERGHSVVVNVTTITRNRSRKQNGRI